MAIKTFIVADARFFDEDAAREQGMTIEDYNEMVIKKINENIKKEDYAILLGVISKGNLVQTSAVLQAINCNKDIIDYQNQHQFTIAEWRAIGINHVWDCAGAQHSQIMGKDSIIIIGNNKKEITEEQGKYYIATAQSIVNTGELYKDKVLNVSMDQWDFEPIEVKERLPQIFDDQELFLTMKEDIKE